MRRKVIEPVLLVLILVSPCWAQAQEWGQQNRTVSITKFSDAFRYSPSSQFAPGDGACNLDWVDDKNLQIVKVTTLASTGRGSLRWALEQQKGPRLVVFEVGGVIDLQTEMLYIPRGHGNVIVAGQTAPSPGITLIRDALTVDAENVILQHIRVRPGADIIGQDRKGKDDVSVDGISVGGSYLRGNVIVDHCTVTWGSDEVLSVFETDGGDLGPGKRAPMQISNCIIADGLRHANLHSQRAHDKGTLLYRGFEHTFVGNLFANVHQRTPYIGAYGGCDALVVNTLMHHIAEEKRGVAIEAGGAMLVSLIGNEYADEPRTYQLDLNRGDNHKPKDIYLKDNEYSELVWGGVYSPVFDKDKRWTYVDKSPVPMHNIKPLPRKQVFAHHMLTVGARPADRTPLDQRVIAQVKEGKGQYIDSEKDVGGYPTLKAAARKLNVPTEAAALGKWLYNHTKAVELPKASVVPANASLKGPILCRNAPDQLAPEVVEVLSAGDKNQQITIVFNEPVHKSANNRRSYRISPEINIKEVSLIETGRVVTLRTSPLKGGVDYTMTFSGIKDPAGNELSKDSVQFRYHRSKPGLRYKCYRPMWKLPEMAKLKPVCSGTAQVPSALTKKITGHQFGLLFEGQIQIPKDGNYTFFTESDDESEVFVDNQKVAASIMKPNARSLKAGRYPFKIIYVERLGQKSMKIFWQGPGIEKQVIPAEAFLHVPTLQASTGL